MVDAFLTSSGLYEADWYAVVSIMGPQSSGKSTLLNILFGTPFVMMDGSRGRSQTTRGIWLSRARNLPLVVLDLQGTDSIEGGEESHKFERQSSLLALALSDVLLVNVWFQDLGRHDASNLSLLRTVMEVHLQLFGRTERPIRTVLLFIIRDHIEQVLPCIKSSGRGFLHHLTPLTSQMSSGHLLVLCLNKSFDAHSASWNSECSV